MYIRAILTITCFILLTHLSFAAEIKGNKPKPLSSASSEQLPLLDIPPNPNAQPIPSIPQDVMLEIKAHPAKYGYTMDSNMSVSDPVIKAKILVINANSVFHWQIGGASEAPRFLALVADKLIVEEPASRENAAVIKIVSKHNLDGLAGLPGKASESHAALEDGSNGGDGTDGGNGGNGYSIDVPPVYVIFNSIETSSGEPAKLPLLKLELNGINGGNGGIGGIGGNGGHGASGTPSVCNVLFCVKEPGVGGNGGNAGKGGKGGDAGHGGNAPNVYVMVSKTSWRNAIFMISQNGGAAGHPGQPGSAGVPGLPGGGGFQCDRCPAKGPGQKGSEPSPANLGGGATSSDGKAGNLYWADYGESNLFAQ